MSKILVVEDEQDYLDELQIALIDEGHEVFTASNGRDGINMGAAYRPDLLIADWMLKNHLHGLHVSEALQSLDACLPTILITGFPSDDLRREAESLAVAAFVEKPFTPEHIGREIRRALASRRPLHPTRLAEIPFVEIGNDDVIEHANEAARELFAESLAGADADRLDQLLDVDSTWLRIRTAKGWIPVSVRAATPTTWFARARSCPLSGKTRLLLLPPERRYLQDHPIIRILLAEPPSTRITWSRSGRVLVVDDFEMIRRVICLSLERIGCMSYSAASHAEARRLIDHDPGIDVVVMDYEMPGEKPDSLIAHVRQVRPDAIVIGTSAEPHGEEFALLGVDQFLLKPFTIVDLADAAARHTQSRAGG